MEPKEKLLIILLISIIITIYNFKYKKFFLLDLFDRISKNYPVINNYKFENISDNPFITFLINFSNPDVNYEPKLLLNFISSLYEDNLLNIQIIFIYKNLTSDFIQNCSNDSIFKDKKIEEYNYEDKIQKNNFIYLIDKIKGKFFMVFDTIIKLEKGDLNNIYNNLKGSTKNIFEFHFHNNLTYYLLRTKLLKNFIDSENDFQNYQDIINLYIQQPYSYINYISVAYCPNNFYASLTYTSMISILSTKIYYSYILFYLIISDDFSQKNMKLIESLYEQFEYFNITFIKMDNRYEKAYTRRYLSKSAFYRLSLGELLPNLNKVIYLDSDTIILKDLSDLYNLNFMGKIFLASMLTFNKGQLNFTINSGVLLLNLKKMRNMKIEKHVLTLLNNNFTDTNYHDQAIINLYYKKYIGFLSPKYNRIKTFRNYLQKYYKDTKKFYDYDSLHFYAKFPSILHYPGPPSKKNYNDEDWYYFARISKYFHKRSNNISNIFHFSL